MDQTQNFLSPETYEYQLFKPKGDENLNQLHVWWESIVFGCTETNYTMYI